ncbi:hypothetical protein HDU93_006228, partial [Gonapodya sp. JEL0774]
MPPKAKKAAEQEPPKRGTSRSPSPAAIEARGNFTNELHKWEVSPGKIYKISLELIDPDDYVDVRECNESEQTLQPV